MAFFACACGFVVFVARFPFGAIAFGLLELGAMVASTAPNGVGAVPISSAVRREPAAVVSPAICDGIAATVVSAEVLDEPTSGTVREGLASIASCPGLGGAAAAATSGVGRIAAGAMLGALALSTLMVGASTGMALPTGRTSDDAIGAVSAEGPQGPQGPQGMAGPQGQQGPPEPQGPKGDADHRAHRVQRARADRRGREERRDRPERRVLLAHKAKPGSQVRKALKV